MLGIGSGGGIGFDVEALFTGFAFDGVDVFGLCCAGVDMVCFKKSTVGYRPGVMLALGLDDGGTSGVGI